MRTAVFTALVSAFAVFAMPGTALAIAGPPDEGEVPFFSLIAIPVAVVAGRRMLRKKNR